MRCPEFAGMLSSAALQRPISLSTELFKDKTFSVRCAEMFCDWRYDSLRLSVLRRDAIDPPDSLSTHLEGSRAACFRGFQPGPSRATLLNMNREMASTKRVLVVDDDSGVRLALVRTLTSAGYAVTSASEASEGLAHLILEPVDLVLSDHLMPNML